MTGSSVGVNSSSAATTPGIDDSMTMSTAILLGRSPRDLRQPVAGDGCRFYGRRDVALQRANGLRGR
jgi:hypothetical protein